MAEFLVRLKQRKLVQWALAYVAFAFALIQGVDVVASQFGWPESLRRGITLALGVGFVVTLVIAWYHGEKGRQRVSGPELLLIALVLAIGGGAVWYFGRIGVQGAATPAVAKAPVASSAVAKAQASPLSSAPTAIAAQPVPAKSIAVLPFENLSNDSSNEYFVAGMQGMILTKLGDIGELKVIARTSTADYASHPEDTKTIGQQLGVATLLEGNVQKAGNEVLIEVRLVNAGSGNQIWAQTYQRTLDNVFGVEGEVAQKVADALKAKLSPVEQQNVAAIPTTNPQAWEAFLKAESLAYKAQDSAQETDYLAANVAYRKAIALDRGFALAYARLAYNQMNGHWFAQHLSPEQLAGVKATAERALALAPELPQAHLALGYYDYWGFRRYDDAVTQFRRTLALAPNDVAALTGLAYIARRRGDFEQALTTLRQVLALAPRDRLYWSEYGTTYLVLRRYSQAVEQLKISLSLDPDFLDARDFYVRALLFGFGNVSEARVVFGPSLQWRISAANLLAGDAYNLIGPRAYIDVFDHRFDAALHDWDSESVPTDGDRLVERVARVAIEVIADRQAAVRTECEKLKPVLDAALAQNPDALGALQRSSWVDVCLGQNAEAIVAARRAAEVLPLGKDAYFGAMQLVGLAQIEAHAGQPDKAIDLIQQLLTIPAGESISVTRLRLDPIWDPLRGNPRFQALLKKYASVQPIASASVASP